MGMSIRAYARQRGVSEGAVRKAIKAGRIPAEADGTIDPVKADAAWERNTDPAQQRKQEPTPPPVRETPPLPQPRPTVRAPSPDPEPGPSNPAVPNYQVSRAIRETYNAKLTRMDYEERQGKPLKAEDVARDAFEMARRAPRMQTDCWASPAAWRRCWLPRPTPRASNACWIRNCALPWRSFPDEFHCHQPKERSQRPGTSTGSWAGQL